MKRLRYIAFLLLPVLALSWSKPAPIVRPAFTPAHVIDDIAAMEYWCVYHTSDDSVFSIYNGAITNMTNTMPGGRLIRKMMGCFNLIRGIATDGSLWQSNQYTTAPAPITWTQIPTDSSGTAINSLSGFGYGDNYVMLNSDSSLSFGGVDNPFVFHPNNGTNVFMRPYKFSGSVKFREAIISVIGIFAITSDSLSLYYWGPGAGTTPTTIYTFSGKKIIHVSSSGTSQYTCATFAIIQQSPGSPYGDPYALGPGWGWWGASSVQTFSSFTDLYSQWGLTSRIRELRQGTQSLIFTDSAGNMGATGWNVEGEVGTGVEYVNRIGYPSWPNYGFDNNYATEDVVYGVQWIGAGHTWTHVYNTSYYGLYNVVQDDKDSCYYFGRGKTEVMPVTSRPGYGLELNTGANAVETNALDVTSPTMGSPLSITHTITLNWVGPTIGIGATTNVMSSADTLTSTGHPALLLNASNNADTIGFVNVSNSWGKISGPGGDVIISPTSKSTRVTFTNNGTYVYFLKTVANNGEIDSTTVTLNVNIQPTNQWIMPLRLVASTMDTVISHTVLAAGPDMYTLDTLTLPPNSAGLFRLYYFAYDTISRATGIGRQEVMLSRLGTVYQAPYVSYNSPYITTGLSTHQVYYTVSNINGLPIVQASGYGPQDPIRWHVLRDSQITPL